MRILARFYNPYLPNHNTPNVGPLRRRASL